MSGGKAATARAVALTGPCGAGKTSLLEAVLFAAGAIPRKGAVAAGNTIGDASPEARARSHSTELNVAHFTYLEDRYAILDCPGSIEFAADGDVALAAADLVVVVVEPDPDKAVLIQPTLKLLDEIGVPHAIFVNKIDKAKGGVRDLIAALQPYSAAALVARQIPMRRGGEAGGDIVGFIDLALERAFLYQAGKPSQRVEIPADELAREAEAREHMLEQIADFDDRLLEDLINQHAPAPDLVFGDLADEVGRGVIVPVFLGSAENGFGIRRLLKALRHETPEVSRAAGRLGAKGRSALVLKTRYAGQAGRQSLVRVLSGEIGDGAEITSPDGTSERVAGVAALMGEAQERREMGAAGDVICLGRLDHPKRGDLVSADGAALSAMLTPIARRPSYALAIETKDRQDDVKLTAAMAKLIDEDPSLEFGPDALTREFKLGGQGEMHLRVALERLARKYGVKVEARRPRTAYRESIQAQATQRGRLKKQSGGHGQFADVVIEVKPAARGAGFAFEQKIHGGVVPKQYFPAVEAGARDALEKGPLGFPVVDIEAVLLDGSAHSVDSSEMAFRTAGRMAVAEALGQCRPVLLEPTYNVLIHTPSEALARITALAPARRGQILAFEPREGWPGWDTVRAYLPEEELHDLILEIRSATQGLGELECSFDHMSEVTGAAAARAIETAHHVRAH